MSLDGVNICAYDIRNHPCCQSPGDNLTLAMIIDAFEIYGHDPTDKLDHLAHYQIEMMKIKRAPDQQVVENLQKVGKVHGNFWNQKKMGAT
ncbi:hypothetical protein MSG28_013724 [Choristoneura fumiferana]|uniref:Uncharacterized protein n=1 Tax=Choristoneura fumiferana TaxID=7141 RepID=A0ACC0K8N5_CHOFU|nr:hypothetical protein MSG28_013724 [Choristoneura fumiferana]